MESAESGQQKRGRKAAHGPPADEQKVGAAQEGQQYFRGRQTGGIVIVVFDSGGIVEEAGASVFRR